MKRKTETTFWLARDSARRKGESITYKLSKYKMDFGATDYHIKNYFLYNECVSILLLETIDLLGLPRLRKGQQVQIKRTSRGFEIVKGNKDGK